MVGTINTFTAAGIVRYDDKRGMNGRLKGLITFTDGKSLKVWDDELHARCQALAKYPVGELRYQFRHSDKWGDSLSMIERTTPDHEIYDAMRLLDEQRGRVQPNSWLGRKIRDSVGDQHRD